MPLHKWYAVHVKNSFQELDNWENACQDAHKEDIQSVVDEGRCHAGGLRGAGRVTGRGPRAEAVASETTARETLASE